MTALGSEPGRGQLLDFSTRPETARTLFLFIPGLGGNRRQWRVVEDTLARHDVAVAHLPAVRPHPAITAGSPLIEDFAAATAREIVEAGYNRVVVLAHSVGSFVGFDLAARIPERMAGVVAVNGALYSVGRFLDRPGRELAVRPSFGMAAARLVMVSAVPTSTRAREFVLRRERLTRVVVGKLVPPEVIESTEARRVLAEGTNQPGILRGLWANRHHWPRFVVNARNVHCPVVLVTGTSDPLTSAGDARRMARLLPAASVELLSGIGHAAPLESPGPIVRVAERLAFADRATGGGVP